MTDAIGQLGMTPRELHRIVLTHGHEDPTGSAAELAAWSGAAVIAHRLEAPVVRGDAPARPPVLVDWERPIFDAKPLLPPAPPVRVDVEVDDGDAVEVGGGARVLAVPGHTDGSIAPHLPGRAVLFTGDTAANVDGRTMPGVFNLDTARTLASFRRLAELNVATACFGHGDPIVEGASAALRAAAREYAGATGAAAADGAREP